MLPTKEASQLGFLSKIGKDRGDLRLFKIESPNILDSENQHLYVISDEQIKENDYFYSTVTKEIKICSKEWADRINLEPSEITVWKKIIATTDKSLNIHLIPTSFLPVFVEAYADNKQITEVSLIMEDNCVVIESDTESLDINNKLYTRDQVLILMNDLWIQATKKTLEPLTEQGFTAWVEEHI